MAWLISFVIGLIGGAAMSAAVLWKRFQKVQSREAAAAKAVTDANVLAGKTREKEQSLARREHDTETDRKRLAESVAKFESRVISYGELQQENSLLKRDLQNIDVYLNKTRLDHELLGQQQRSLDDRGATLARRYLADATKTASDNLTVNNFANVKEKLLKVIEQCRSIGYPISPEEEARYVAELQREFESLVRAAALREEQVRIKAQIREEERLQREAARAIEQADREKIAIQAALDQALAAARDQHGEEIAALRAQLAEAESRSERAKSMAEQTRAGNVYVISNIGSFGPGVFKIGMTRRLEPLDRVKELGDASVPFPFDVHLMVACDDAPALENAIHRVLHTERINKVNPRKEFFKAEIDAIVAVVQKHCGEVQYRADPEAFEYRQSLTMRPEDADYIESVFDAADTATGVVED
jgi:hypothetical protein